MWNFEGVADVQECACACVAHLAEVSVRARAPLMALLAPVKRALAVHTSDAGVQVQGLSVLRVLTTDATSRVCAAWTTSSSCTTLSLPASSCLFLLLPTSSCFPRLD
jgi:hypothetical protein